jgi:hypothetical protein
MRPRSLLVNEPESRPAEFGGPCLKHERVHELRVAPTYSILVSAFNAAARLRVVTTQLLKLTRGDWELVILCDACTDGSLDVVHDTLARSSTWPPCPYTAVDSAAVSHQGDMGRECWLNERGRLTRTVLIDVTGAELFETAANNVLLLAARAPYSILVQGDQIMTQPGWNVALSTPLATWPDVFSASARCAHAFDHSQQDGLLTGTKCLSSLRPQPVHAADRCRFYVRDTGNRGPLALHTEYAQRLGFLDETRFFGTGDDEHDINLRAYARHAWVSGHAPVDYTEERCCRSPVNRTDGGALTARYKQWLTDRAERLKAVPGTYGAPAHAFVQGGHDENRVMGREFWDGCSSV